MFFKFNTNHSRILAITLFKNIKTIMYYYPKLTKMAKHPEKYDFKKRYDYLLKMINRVFKCCDLQIKVFGLDNIPKEDGLFVCANHQEKFDALVLWNSFPRTLGVIADGFASRRHFIREIMKIVPSIKMHKNSMKSMVKSIETLTEELQNKVNYMIFPEGKYEIDCKKLLPFLGGCFKSPLRAKAIIQPVAIINSNHLFDKDLKKPYEIQVHYLKPIYPSEFKDMKSLDLANLVQDKIQKAVDKYQN